MTQPCDPLPDRTFLVGAERSGTTMLRLMLSHHPRLAWSNEFEYAVDCVGRHGEPPDLDTYRAWLATHRIFLAAQLEVDPALDYLGLVDSFLTQRQLREHKPLVGATVHRHFDRLLHLWPRAKLIHLVRDGRDVAQSCIGMGWAGNVWTGLERWIEAEHLWETVARLVPPERRHEVTFESLVADPPSVLAGVCGFLGVEYDPLMLAYDKDTTYERPDRRLIQQWKSKQSQRAVRLMESRIGEMLVRRGYELSGLPPLEVSAWERARLRLQDRWFRLRWRQRRYGMRLWWADIIARRIGGRQWRDGVRLRLNEIDRQHLR